MTLLQNQSLAPAGPKGTGRRVWRVSHGGAMVAQLVRSELLDGFACCGMIEDRYEYQRYPQQHDANDEKAPDSPTETASPGLKKKIQYSQAMQKR